MSMKKYRRLNVRKTLIFLCLTILVYHFSMFKLTGAQPLQGVVIPYEKTPKVIIDGRIGVNEYPYSYLNRETGITVYWVHDGEKMYVALVSPGRGWVGIGFGPKGVGMQGANELLFYVKDSTGETFSSDNYGEGHLHFPDTSRGGSNDIIKSAGTQNESFTVIEFIFPLSSGDKFDHDFKLGGTYGFNLAFQESADNFVTIHTKRSSSINVFIEPKETTKKVTTKLMIDLPRSVIIDREFKIKASLLDQGGKPVPNATINFFVNTTFGGEILIASTETDSGGEATLTYSFRIPGTIKVNAYFPGGKQNNVFLDKCNSSKRVVVKTYEPGFFTGPRDPLYNFGVWILNNPHKVHISINHFLDSGFPLETLTPEKSLSLGSIIILYMVIFSVWTTFAFVFYQIYRIYREGKK